MVGDGRGASGLGGDLRRNSNVPSTKFSETFDENFRRNILAKTGSTKSFDEISGNFRRKTSTKSRLREKHDTPVQNVTFQQFRRRPYPTLGENLACQDPKFGALLGSSLWEHTQGANFGDLNGCSRVGNPGQGYEVLTKVPGQNSAPQNRVTGMMKGAFPER